VIALLIAFLIGWLGIRLWLSGAPLAVQLSLGMALGMGATSCIYFLLLIAGLGTLPVVAVVDGVLLVALAAANYRFRPAAPAAAAKSGLSWNWVFGLAALAAVGLFVAAFFTASDLNPQGGWDAFAIWNLRARFLTTSATWRFAVTPYPTGGHMEYPLLLSSFIARGWVYGGAFSSAVPIAIALLAAVALIAVLGSTLAAGRSLAAGLLAVCILLANPVFFSAAPDQYSDLPLALFSLAAGGVFALGDDPRVLTFSGLFAGFAAWTKNEGLLLAAALATALAVAASMRKAALFLVGALPVLALVLWLKLFVAPADPLVGGMAHSLAQAASPARWMQVAGGFLKGAPWIPLVLLALAAALLRFVQPVRAAWIPLIAFALVLAGDFAVFLLTRLDLEWLLSTALDRIYLQLWPLLVFSVFLLLRNPEEFMPAPAARAAAKERRPGSRKSKRD
jgi:hypothetical protein